MCEVTPCDLQLNLLGRHWFRAKPSTTHLPPPKDSQASYLHRTNGQSVCVGAGWLLCSYYPTIDGLLFRRKLHMFI